MNKENLKKPGMSKGALATAALAGLLFTQSIASTLPENLKEIKETAQKIFKLENPYIELVNSYENFYANRLDNDALKDFLNKVDEVKKKSFQAIVFHKNYLFDFLVQMPRMKRGIDYLNENVNDVLEKIKESVKKESSLENVLSDYFGDELVKHYFNTYNTVETKLKPSSKIENYYDYGVNSLETLSNLYFSGFLKEEHVKFIAEGYNFYKDRYENPPNKMIANLDKRMMPNDLKTRINLLGNYIRAKQNNTDKGLEFFDWVEYNILRNLDFNRNPAINDSLVMKVLKEGFNAEEIPLSKLKNMEKSMEKYDFASLYEKAEIDDPEYMHSKIMQESGFNQRALSPAGAKGFSQLMKETAQMMNVNRDKPEQNVLGGAKYSKMISDYLAGYPKDIKLLVGPAGYNWGHANIYKVLEGKKLPKETREYIKKVNGYRKTFQEMKIFEKQIPQENYASNQKIIGA